VSANQLNCTEGRRGTSSNSAQIDTSISNGLRWQSFPGSLRRQVHLPTTLASRLHSLDSTPPVSISLASPNTPDNDADSPGSPMSSLLHPSTTERAPPTPTGSSPNTPTDAPNDQVVMGTSSQAIIACNSISIVACVLVIVIYALLHRKHTRLMQRTSLVLSCAMATSDLLLHVSVFLTETPETKARRVTRLPLRINVLRLEVLCSSDQNHQPIFFSPVTEKAFSLYRDMCPSSRSTDKPYSHRQPI
jgi:hypothetical protein